MANTPHRPATGLGPEGKALWCRLQAAYQIEDEGGLLLLTRICESRDLVVEAMAEVRRDGFVVVDKYGAKRGHPLLTVARDARARELPALKMLALDLEPVKGFGRPGSA